MTTLPTPLAGACLVPLMTPRFHGRFYAIDAAILLSMVGLSASGVAAGHPGVEPILIAFLVVTFAHSLHLVWARPRPLVFRASITWPALFLRAHPVGGRSRVASPTVRELPLGGAG